MEATQQQALAFLEKRLRFSPQKEEYIRYLNECSTPGATVFDKQRIAFSLYKDIYGKIYTFPEFPSLVSMKDAVARYRFGYIMKGVAGYFNASAERQAEFRKKVLSRPNIISRIFIGPLFYQHKRV